MSKYYKGKNTQIEEIMTRYEHYGYMTGADLKAFRDYRDEINQQYKFWEYALEDAIDDGRNPLNIQIMLASMKPEVEEITYINQYKIYNSTLTSLYTMSNILESMWYKQCSGYSSNPFFAFKELVDMVNAYWQIEKPYKPSNKIAYGWKFSMEKADQENGWYSKSWKLYMWGCIKNYLIRNGIEFTKDESLKVRKIVGLVMVYEATE